MPASGGKSGGGAKVLDGRSITRKDERGDGLAERLPEQQGGTNSRTPIFSAHVHEPLYRIDYCFVGAALGLTPSAAMVATHMTHSDHYPVVFDLSKRMSGHL